MGIGIFIVSVYATEGHTFKHKLSDLEDRIQTESSVIQATAYDEENPQGSIDELKKVVNEKNVSEISKLINFFLIMKMKAEREKVRSKDFSLFYM